MYPNSLMELVRSWSTLKLDAMKITQNKYPRKLINKQVFVSNPLKMKSIENVRQIELFDAVDLFGQSKIRNIVAPFPVYDVQWKLKHLIFQKELI